MRTFFLVGSLLCISCFGPDDILPIEGTVQSTDGVEGLTVELLRDPALDPERACSQLQPFKTTTTNSSGAYRFDVFRAQSESLGQRGLFCFRVRVRFPSGAEAHSNILFHQQPERLRPLIDWRAQPRLEGESLHFAPPMSYEEADNARISLDHRYQFISGDGGVIWQEDDRIFDVVEFKAFRHDFRLTTAQREDFSGKLKFQAVMTYPPPQVSLFGSGRPDLPTWLVAAESPEVIGNSTPPSRGLPCELMPCPLTDGALIPIALDAGTETTEPQEVGRLGSVSVKFPDERQVSSLVFRATCGTFVTALRSDGGVFWARPLPGHPTMYGIQNGEQRFVRIDAGPVIPIESSENCQATWSEVTFDGGTPLAGVRVQTRSISELSIFP